MAALRGRTVLLNSENIGANAASKWAYVGSATDVSLFIDDNGHAANWLVEVAVGNGEPGLNGIDQANPNAVPSAILLSKTGADAVHATSGTPVTIDLSPFAGQYIRIRPDAAVAGAKASIATLARNSRSLRGHQTLWKNATVSNGTLSPIGFVGNDTNVVLFIFNAGAFDILSAPGDGSAGMNFVPLDASFAALPFSFAGTGANQAVDLSPFAGQYIRLRAKANASGVNASLAVAD